MTGTPPPLPVAQPPPLPWRESRLRRRLPLLFFLLALSLLYVGPLRVEVDFTDDAGRMPVPFRATLRSSFSEKNVVVKKGRLTLLRGLWQEIDVHDLSYLRSRHPVRGGKMHLVIERNLPLKLKHASLGSASIPQRGDPDPQRD